MLWSTISLLGLEAWEGSAFVSQICSLISLCFCLQYRKDYVILNFTERSYLHEDLDQSKGSTFRNALALATDLANKCFTFFLCLLETWANFVRKVSLLVVPATTYANFGLFILKK